MGLRIQKLKRVFATVLAAALSVSTLFSGAAFGAPEWPQDVYTAAEGACIIDADSKVVLFGKNQDTAYYPASITKVMTALVVLENCKDLNEIVTFSASAVAFEEENATLIGASEGDQLTVRDCLYALLFASANEVANALAEHVGAKHPELKTSGDETDREVFVRMMNDKAKALGCKGTHFNNPSGLTDQNHYTTAYDMCLIMAAAIENSNFVDIESHTYWTHAPIKRYPDPSDPWNTVYPRHQMLKRNSPRYYPGVFAGKTGYTMTAGNTLVTACRKDGMTLVATVLNGHNSQYNDTKRLLDFGYNNFQSLKISDYDTAHDAIDQDMTIDGLPVLDATTLGIDKNSRITLPKSADFSEISKTLSTQSAGASSAQLIYQYGDRVVGTAQLETEKLGGLEALQEAESDPLLQHLEEETTAPDVLGESNAGGEPGANASGAAAASAQNGAGGTVSTESAEVGDALTGGDGAGARTNAISDASGQGAENGGQAQAKDGNGAAASGAGQNGSAAAEDAASASRQLGSRTAESLFGLPPAAVLVLKVVLGAAVLFFVGCALFLYKEKKEAMARARRRQQRLRHTRDLTQSQSIKMDLLIQQRLRKRKRKSKK